MTGDATLDRLVANYLDRLERALSGLAREPRRRLVADIAQHIEEACAEAPQLDETVLQGILARLGEPETIASAALEDRSASSPPRARHRVRLVVGAAVIVVLAGAAVAATTLTASGPLPPQRTRPATVHVAASVPRKVVTITRDAALRRREGAVELVLRRVPASSDSPARFVESERG